MPLLSYYPFKICRIYITSHFWFWLFTSSLFFLHSVWLEAYQFYWFPPQPNSIYGHMDINIFFVCFVFCIIDFTLIFISLFLKLTLSVIFPSFSGHFMWMDSHNTYFRVCVTGSFYLTKCFWGFSKSLWSKGVVQSHPWFWDFHKGVLSRDNCC